jgi:hypothetical protein
MACTPEHPLCLVIADWRRLQLTYRAKGTEEGISLSGSTFDFRLSERFSDGTVGDNVWSWSSSAETSNFDLTDLANGVIALLILTTNSDDLDSTKKYVGQLRRISGGQPITMCFFDVTAKARP